MAQITLELSGFSTLHLTSLGLSTCTVCASEKSLLSGSMS